MNASDAELFAIEVVKKLKTAGFEALWAGGCVRDRLLNRIPKDFDVATSATPTEIRQLFGRKRTLGIGEAFGVIAVLGHNKNQIEVATFRKDADYSDGRRPDSVSFCDAKEDAIRRDFTINGLFFDPINDTVIDYVEGEADLKRRLVRAIGNPDDRFGEDKLRILRAVRFAAVLDFQIESETLAAVVARASEVLQVSAERISAELRRLLTGNQAVRGLRLLAETGLLAILLPECEWTSDAFDDSADFALAEQILTNLKSDHFGLGLAALLRHRHERAPTKKLLGQVCQRWKTTNAEQALASAALEYEPSLRAAHRQPWSKIQPLLIHNDASVLVDFAESVAVSCSAELEGVRLCRTKLNLPPDQLNPAPLITGNDLKELEVPIGGIYRQLLSKTRAAQLDGEIATRDDAVKMVLCMLNSNGEG